MSLANEIAKLKEEMGPKIPDNIKQLFGEKTKELIESGLADGALKVGDKIPEFSLSNVNGDTLSSADLLAQGTLIISFYRGSWCPYCNLELHALQLALPQIKEAGAQLIGISPELHDKAITAIENHSLEFEVLSDLGNAVARKFGLVFTLAEELRPVYKEFGIDLPTSNGDDSYEIPFPATYVVGQDGVIKYAFINADYTQRSEPADVIAAI